MAWIFAYGSLMWRPCFDYEEKITATISGYHRAFNKASTVRWGSPDHPAPTLGVEDGGTMTGIAYHVHETAFDETMAYLQEREGTGFHFKDVPAELADGRTVTVKLAVNDHDDSYIGDTTIAERAQMAAQASGEAGTGAEYVLNTWDKMQECGIKDAHVQELAGRVRRITRSS